jgi:hypothetical protein
MMVLPLVQRMLSPVLVAVTLGMACPFTTQPDLFVPDEYFGVTKQVL